MMMLEAEHDVRIHRDEAAIAVVGEAAVAGEIGERFHGLVVEAEIENGIHHARHRGPRAGSDRDQKRIFGIAERFAGQLADIFQRLLDLRLQFLRIGLVVLVEIRADRGRDGEAGGTGKPRLAISARLAPLPPSRSRKLASPSALPSPNV